MLAFALQFSPENRLRERRRMTKEIGYAVMGLGALARNSILPAFARVPPNSRLVAVISRDRAKAEAVGAQFGATAYRLDEFRQCLSREDVNALYIALPTSLHSDYTVEAARAGVHVLCEAPMAMVADECRRMIRTCQTNRTKLMLAYRFHFRPAPQKALELVRAGEIGLAKTVSSNYTLRVDDPSSACLQRRMGGGTVYYLGVRCINAARSVLGAEPAQVMAMTARTSRRYGGDVDECAVGLIRFPEERLAHFHTSFGEEPGAELTIFGEDGLIRLADPYEPDAETTLQIVKHGERRELRFEAADAFAATIDHFSDCVIHDRQPEPDGVEGLQDVRMVEAIYRSGRDGRPVTLPRLARVETSRVESSLRQIPLDRREAG
jgi:predicted dehydrogenase